MDIGRGFLGALHGRNHELVSLVPKDRDFLRVRSRLGHPLGLAKQRLAQVCESHHRVEHHRFRSPTDHNGARDLGFVNRFGAAGRQNLRFRPMGTPRLRPPVFGNPRGRGI